MCGIFGVWNLDSAPVDLPALQKATTALRHRGPDDEGYLLVNVRLGQIFSCAGCDTDPSLNLTPVDAFQNREFDLAFGFRRLAILDISPLGHQPMSSADGCLWIVYNGEIYNYLELRTQLTGYGFKFRTGTDTEVVLASYRYWGPECLSHFNGMWAFALWDNQKKQFFIARDRFGIKPFYYIMEKDRFTFASEIKSFIHYNEESLKPEPEAIYSYLVGGILPSPQKGQTFFTNVCSLPPGNCMSVKPYTLEKRRYWSLQNIESHRQLKQSSDVVDRYLDLFTDAVRLEMQSDVPLGSCLSGGVDSSSIVCMVNRLMLQEGLSRDQIGGRQKTFSAVYDIAGPYNERKHIEQVLCVIKAEKNLTFPTEEKLRTEIERLVWHQDEPFQSLSLFAQWCVMNMVGERGVKVLLDGQGADEALGGYRPFTIFLGDLVRRHKIIDAAREALTIHAESGLGFGSLLVSALAWQLPDSWVRSFRRQRYAPERVIRMLNPDFAAKWDVRTVINWKPWSDFQSHLIDSIQESSLPHLLRYEDRNSMAFGIEARVPFLDHRLIELSFGDAADLRIYKGWTKWVLRKAMHGILPNEIAWRRDKVGFETPDSEWINKWLKLENLFHKNALISEYLNMDALQKHVGFFQSIGSNVHPIWRWINLELWLRKFFTSQN